MPMKSQQTPPSGTRRLQRFRARQEHSGQVRVEVAIPASDAQLVRALAGQLRAGGAAATATRETLAPLLATTRARTGAELLAFFRASPLSGLELHIERDQGAGRDSPL